MQAENITPIQDPVELQVQYGTVLSCDDRGFQIEGRSGSYLATPAFSCLVVPTPGDRVICSIDPVGKSHILSIIERVGSQDTRLEFPGEVTLDAAQGQLNLNGQQGLNLTSPQKINQASEEYSVIAKSGLVGIESLNAVGTKLVAKFGNVQTFADTIETVAGNLLQKLKNSIRLVEGVHQSRAGDVISTVKNLYSLRSRQAAILAKGDIKMDAERIHMG